MPLLEASTSTTKGRLGSGCLSIGAVMKLFFRLVKAWLASSFHLSLEDLSLSRDVKGVAIVADKLTVEVGKSKEVQSSLIVVG